ncbi:unnamed protein product [Caenorhabditis angaria]|uniref:BTB domain-containing protein n=1 Tax=Caenorhabditis angaria TaxID=860376 RepID=A0A9P1IDD9_9PELO|nr:unnamed protein product [Caenorhabditis angaria]
MNPIVSEELEIKHTFNEISDLSDFTVSDDLVSNNIIWNISIEPLHKEPENVKLLTVNLYLAQIQPPIQNFICEVNAKFDFWKDDQIIGTRAFPFALCYRNVRQNWGFAPFMQWSNLIALLVSDTLTIRVKFTYKFYNFDLNREDFRSFPVKFEVGRLFVNKQYVAMYSKHLQEEFKKSPKCLKIEDESVNIKDFCLLYAAIHPNPIQITGKTFVKLLYLAKRFKIDSLIEKCVENGANSPIIPIIEKFRGAELLEPDNRLMVGCLDLFKTPRDFKIFALDPDFETLRDSTRFTILMALVKMVS